MRHPETNPERQAPERALTMRLLWIALALLVVAGVSITVAVLLPEGGQADVTTSSETYPAKQGPLTISVTEPGTIKNRDQIVIKNEVEGRTTVVSLVEEGSKVQPGDVLVKLDTSKLEEQLTSQEISVLNSEANLIRARENVKVIKNQSESDVAQAELDFRFAEEDLRQYNDGEYPQLLNQAKSKITIAEEELKRALDKVTWSRKLRSEKYISDNDLQADELAWKRASLDLDLSRGDLDLLERFTYKRRVDELESSIKQAERALERVQLKAAADVIQAEADFKAKEQEHDRQKYKLDKIHKQMARCEIKAPIAGVVVYATTGRGRYRGNEEPLKEGQEVYERQELMYLPVANEMMAEVKVHESSLEKVEEGQLVKITVDAVPGKSFPGRVAKIASYPDQQSAWLNPDLKLYTTEIDLECDATGLRTGMSCKAEIIVEEHDSAVSVPVQSVLRVGGQPTVYTAAADGSPVPVPVEIGLDNNRFVHIRSGITVGTEVLLAPPIDPSTLDDEEGADGLEQVERTESKSREKKDDKAKDGRRGDRGERSRGERGGRSQGDGEKSQGGRPSPEEMRKRWESMSEEEKQKMREKYQNMGGGSGGPRRN